MINYSKRLSSKEKKSVLIIDDSDLIITSLKKLLSDSYLIFSAKEGVQGFEKAKRIKPDLILLDVILPDINGYDICEKIKKNNNIKDIPIIFITSTSETKAEERAFEVGGADFIVKPFVPAVVLARIRNHIRLAESIKEIKSLYQMALDMNPITGLPGNNSIKKQIGIEIDDESDSIIVYCDLDNFKSYNDKYGFARGDEVILFTAKLFERIAAIIGDKNIFIGHIGGDDFVLIIQKDNAEEYIIKYIEEFDREIVNYYSKKDIQKNGIYTKNRRGVLERYPIISMSFAGVDLTNNNYSKYLEINDICVQRKNEVKKLEGSNYIID